jgi:hypothetical protein
MTDTATNARQHEEKIARIRSNRDLSDQAKQRMIREIHEEAAREHRRLVAEAREAREQAVRSAERMIFSISFPERATASEKALIALSYRDARDRAERAAANRENQDALEDLLDRAEKTGDAQLAEATYHVAAFERDAARSRRLPRRQAHGAAKVGVLRRGPPGGRPAQHERPGLGCGTTAPAGARQRLGGRGHRLWHFVAVSAPMAAAAEHRLSVAASIV